MAASKVPSLIFDLYFFEERSLRCLQLKPVEVSSSSIIKRFDEHPVWTPDFGITKQKRARTHRCYVDMLDVKFPPHAAPLSGLRKASISASISFGGQLSNRNLR